ncbi:MAG TPA: gamma-glutamyl-gamma-aminobutyrate hydrolase family protein [Syntrophales bacterium]|nr:gamma-glutamyl-gamma-aminobutyrate hydrolase family protein [Syntrophales bacterium]
MGKAKMVRPVPRPPVIGLNMSLEGGALPGTAGRLHIALDYVDAVAAAGGVPICIPPCEDHRRIRTILPLLKGFLLIGGDDYQPAHYGGHPQPPEELMPLRRDRFDIALARLILEETELPVLGICGGHQLLAIARGGALIQDIGTEWRPPEGGPPLPHSGRDRARHTGDDGASAPFPGPPPPPSPGAAAGRGAAAVPGGCHPTHGKGGYLHSVRFAPASLAARAAGVPPGKTLATNSFHHQAVHPERVGRDLAASAWSSDGIIEAVEAAPGSSWAATGRFVLGVQWHPERLPDEEPHRRLFRSLVRAAGGSGRRQSE